MQPITEVEIVSRLCRTTLSYFEVALEDEVISQLCDRQQALQAGVHVAVKSIILEANNPILVIGHPIVL